MKRGIIVFVAGLCLAAVCLARPPGALWLADGTQLTSTDAVSKRAEELADQVVKSRDHSPFSFYQWSGRKDRGLHVFFVTSAGNLKRGTPLRHGASTGLVFCAWTEGVGWKSVPLSAGNEAILALLREPGSGPARQAEGQRRLPLRWRIVDVFECPLAPARSGLSSLSINEMWEISAPPFVWVLVRFDGQRQRGNPSAFSLVDRAGRHVAGPRAWIDGARKRPSRDPLRFGLSPGFARLMDPETARKVGHLFAGRLANRPGEALLIFKGDLPSLDSLSLAAHGHRAPLRRGAEERPRKLTVVALNRGQQSLTLLLVGGGQGLRKTLNSGARVVLTLRPGQYHAYWGSYRPDGKLVASTATVERSESWTFTQQPASPASDVLTWHRQAVPLPAAGGEGSAGVGPGAATGLPSAEEYLVDPGLGDEDYLAAATMLKARQYDEAKLRLDKATQKHPKSIAVLSAAAYCALRDAVALYRRLLQVGQEWGERMGPAEEKRVRRAREALIRLGSVSEEGKSRQEAPRPSPERGPR